MRFVSPRVLYSICFYVLIIILLFVATPPLIFDKSRNFRQFGIGEKKTMFSFGVFVVSIAFLSFYLFAIIDLIFVTK